MKNWINFNHVMLIIPAQMETASDILDVKYLFQLS